MEQFKIDWSDISPDFRPNYFDRIIGNKLIELEGTPEAIVYFSEVCQNLSNYGYWFFLSTLWVSYTEWSDLQLWKKLFSSNRPRRRTSIMKPGELRAYDALTYNIFAYRAHRPDEKDWISYTLYAQTAAKFAAKRGVDRVALYWLRKPDIIALFLRRGEQEIIMLDPVKAEFMKWVKIEELPEVPA